MRKRGTLLALLAAATFGLASCSSSANKPTVAPPTPSPPAGRFPVTVQTSTGTVTVEHRPTRVVSLSATATQMLYTIAAGRQVVAVDKYSTIPSDAPVTNLDPDASSAEDIERYRPDLVLLTTGGPSNLVNQLATLGVPSLMLPAANTLDDTWSQYRQIGLATGHVAQAAAEIARLQAGLKSVEQRVGKRAKGLTYYEEISPNLYTATSHTFIGDLFGLLGMVNVADAAQGAGSGYPQLSAEYLIKSDPDWVFLADDVCCGQTAASFGSRPGYSTMTAVKDHHVVAINDSVASQWGPNVVPFLQDVADAVTGSHRAQP